MLTDYTQNEARQEKSKKTKLIFVWGTGLSSYLKL